MKRETKKNHQLQPSNFHIPPLNKIEDNFEIGRGSVMKTFITRIRYLTSSILTPRIYKFKLTSDRKWRRR